MYCAQERTLSAGIGKLLCWGFIFTWYLLSSSSVKLTDPFFFFYLALSAAISKSVNDIIIEESSKTFFFFSLICTDGLPCYRRIGVSVWSACLLLLRKRDPLDVVVFFSLCVCSKGHLLQVTTTNSPKKALHLHIPIVSCSTAPFWSESFHGYCINRYATLTDVL